MTIINGTYKLKTNEGLTDILAAQGVGMVARNLANGMNQTFKFEYDEAAKTIIQTVVAKNENVNTLVIDGPEVEKEAAGGRGTLLDSVKLSDKGFILTRKEKTGAFTLENEFVFEEGKMTIMMKCTKKDGKVVTCKRFFVKE